MRSLGVDLASQPAKTSCAILEWHADRVTIAEIHGSCDDDLIVRLANTCDAVGIDSPFGWPIRFREFISRREAPVPWEPAFRDSLRFRRTDLEVRKYMKRWPLSVSTDLIGVPALRCRGLLQRLGVEDRSGDGRVYETYPALGLHLWGVQSRGYKGAGKDEVRAAVWRSLAAAAPWLQAETSQVEAMHSRCDDLDAVVAALLAAAALRGLVEPLDEEARCLGREEGWITIPKPDALASLAPPW